MRGLSRPMSFAALVVMVSIVVSACHKPLRDRPKSRQRQGRGGTEAGIDAKARVKSCRAVEAALAIVEKDGKIEASRLQAAEFPPASLQDVLSRHFVFRVAGEAEKPLRLVSVFVAAESCEALATFEADLTKDSSGGLPCEAGKLAVDGSYVVVRAKEEKQSSPYEASWGQDFHEVFVVSEKTIALKIFARPTCHDFAPLTRELKAVEEVSKGSAEGEGEKKAKGRGGKKRAQS